ncbi:MAG: hypothetical protein A3G59_00580 [Candidatus Taylorbacteria bacterium RIFCSPLOWO2_12_FULL_47_20]|uniref:Uncharacterized protein n=1 Tax=Candidatus Taylorbacteria bacterium RIFCSPLOWO2_12_FULL_47_20 TaxID=1802335 RepID=A0A1G2P7X0_9BACT|nr:MAG: hypothetical protein A3G59_00580 [Candidatus Taylorbacteria bacterium RIFCSPLOWO2_12_FULL_47_20]
MKALMNELTTTVTVILLYAIILWLLIAGLVIITTGNKGLQRYISWTIKRLRKLALWLVKSALRLVRQFLRFILWTIREMFRPQQVSPGVPPRIGHANPTRHGRGGRRI